MREKAHMAINGFWIYLAVEAAHFLSTVFIHLTQLSLPCRHSHEFLSYSFNLKSLLAIVVPRGSIRKGGDEFDQVLSPQDIYKRDQAFTKQRT